MTKKKWRNWAGLEKRDNTVIRAIFHSKGFSESDFGKKTALNFTDIYYNGGFLAKNFSSGDLKCFSKISPKEGDIFQFEAQVEQTPISLKITRPKNVKKIEIEGGEECFIYCINKFLKRENTITKEAARKERVAFSKMALRFGTDMNFWKFISLPFYLNSLYWFSTEDGLNFLKENHHKFNRQNISIKKEVESFEILENKVGEKVIVDKKKQTLMDFLS